jgi:hypothetical protein
VDDNHPNDDDKKDGEAVVNGTTNACEETNVVKMTPTAWYRNGMSLSLSHTVGMMDRCSKLIKPKGLDRILHRRLL